MKWVAGLLTILFVAPAAYAQSVDPQVLMAQIQAIQQQIAALQGASIACDLPTHTMRRGSSGDDVTRLQQFLARDKNIYPEATISGYFGALTERAVQRWQVKAGIVSSGSAATTGYGAVGPRTLVAMRAVWCLQSELMPAPFTPPKGATPGTPTTTSKNTAPAKPQIVFTAPTASTTVYKGNSVSISWQSTLAPSGSTVSISLQSKSGATIGMIKSGLTSIGAYYWTVPNPAPVVTTGPCQGTPIDCLSQIANTQPDCTSLCTVADGLYKFYAQLLSGTQEIAHAESRIFSVGGIALSPQDINNVGTVWNFGSTGTSTLDPFVNNNWTPTDNFTPGQSCMYSGIPYSDGITLEINCADVTAPGQSCGNFGGLKLSCKNGVWVDQNGNPKSVRNVTTVNTAGSCTTPWGSTLVANGNQVPQYPFFTNGNYPTTGAPLIMKCSNGSWQTCDTVGDHCH